MIRWKLIQFIIPTNKLLAVWIFSNCNLCNLCQIEEDNTIYVCHVSICHSFEEKLHNYLKGQF